MREMHPEAKSANGGGAKGSEIKKYIEFFISESISLLIKDLKNKD